MTIDEHVTAILEDPELTPEDLAVIGGRLIGQSIGRALRAAFPK